MVDLEMTIENDNHEDKKSKRLSLLSARWSSPWIVMLLVCTAGAGDGALRAVCILPVGVCRGRDRCSSNARNPFLFGLFNSILISRQQSWEKQSENQA